MNLDPATVARVGELFEALDYELLGELYCDDGGTEFWADRRDATFELGLQWASALKERLPAGGRSLYMGAGVAELPALVVEAAELGREVRIANRLERECEELNRALGSVGLDQVRLEPCCVTELLEQGPFDHFAMVSVLTDPDFYPQISGVTYGRIPPVLLDVGAFVAERDTVRELFHAVVSALQPPFWITTTVEEANWFLWEAERRGLEVEASEDFVETAVIGDPIGWLRCSSPTC